MIRKKSNSNPSPRPPAGPVGDCAKTAPGPRVELLAAIALSLWILFLHGLFLFHAGPLWRDEVGTIDFAAMPTLSALWQHLQYDNFPPLFVGVARVWTLAGWSADFSYRLLGFLVGAGTLGVLWFGARAGGAGVPLLALALYAVNPLAVRVGDSMRPYGLGFALNLLALTLIWRFVENPRGRTWFWATVPAVLSVHCLYQSAFFLAAFCLAGCAAALGRRQWKTAAQTVAIGGVSALSLLPYWGNISKARDWQGTNVHPVRLHEIGSTLAKALNASGPWLVWFWAGLALLAVGTALVLAIRARVWKMIYFGAALVAATLCYGLFLQKIGLQQRTWYFLILLGPAALAIDVILAGLAARAICLGRACLALLLAASSIPACYAGAQIRQSNADLVAETLRRQARPGDLILVSPWYYGVALQRYYTNHFDTVPPVAELRIHRYDLMKKQMLAENPIGPLLEQARQTLRSGHVFWVAGDFSFPPPGQPQPLLPPYREDMVMDVPGAHYWSSWMFQFSQMVQSHSTSGFQVELSVPGGGAINREEDMLLLQFSGWRE
ncbi:MAG: glycosyltransferase family 39 protein [Verrucomicrobiota bacterium]|jgi:hypothetical protein